MALTRQACLRVLNILIRQTRNSEKPIYSVWPPWEEVPGFQFLKDLYFNSLIAKGREASVSKTAVLNL